MKRGKFITFEGGEGVGKTTNLSFVRELLNAKGVSVIMTREPGGTPLAERIRELLLANQEEEIAPKAELLMIFAARAQHINQVIEPALQQGQWVLCDRFTDATYAYQGGGRGLDLQMIQWLEQSVQGDLRPDLTLLLDAPVETGLQRAKYRGKLDRFELEQSLFFERIRAVYLAQAKKYKSRFKVINAAQPLSDVQNELSRIIRKSLL